MSKTSENAPMGAKDTRADPPGYETATMRKAPVDTKSYPKLVCSTYNADGLEAYVEVDSVAQGLWNDEAATLVTLVIVHTSPATVRCSTTTLTISAAPSKEDTPSSSTALAPAHRPTVLLHAPSFLRRVVTMSGRSEFLTFGVFAPPPEADQDQEVVVKLEDPLLVGLPDRSHVYLVVASHAAPFVISGVIRPKSVEWDGHTQVSSEERRDRGLGAIIDPAHGPVAARCNKCGLAQRSLTEPNVRCAGLDPRHVTDESWAYLASSRKWPAKELAPGANIFVNHRAFRG